MTWRAVTVALLLTGLAVFDAGPASADCRETTSTVLRNGIARTVVTVVCAGSASGSGSDGDSNAPLDPEMVRWGRNQVINCLAEARDVGLNPADFCGEQAASPVLVTPTLVSRALSQQRLPPSKLRLQPPNGRTLVNFDTNFFTERPAFTRVVRLLGQRVELRIEPASFTWHFDNGETRTTTTPGAPYPRLLVTHDYQQQGTYRPRVDTTYTATFRVGSGPWRPVPGSVTITGPSVALEAVEAQPVLTDP